MITQRLFFKRSITFMKQFFIFMIASVILFLNWPGHCLGIMPLNDWVIIPRERVGPITRRTTEADLISWFGKENVRQEIIDYGELADPEDVTRVYPNDPAKEFIVIWKDNKYRRSPKLVRIVGTPQDKMVWQLKNGIRIGTRLKELQKLNGKPFSLVSFHTCFPGRLNSWNQGHLQDLLDTRNSEVLLYLRPEMENGKPKYVTQEEFDAASNSGASDHPSMQKLNPFVYEIEVIFK
jgi:hypothetical protein